MPSRARPSGSEAIGSRFGAIPSRPWPPSPTEAGALTPWQKSGQPPCPTTSSPSASSYLPWRAEMYEPRIDVDAVAAIDVHTHIEADGHGHLAMDDELLQASAKYFKAGHNRTPTLDEIADYYRERHIAAVVFTVDASTVTGHPPLSNEEIAEGAAKNADVLIPFGSVDPWHGKAAMREIERLVTEFGVRGFKFHPSLQGFEPNDQRFYPLYETLQRLGVLALF